MKAFSGKPFCRIIVPPATKEVAPPHQKIRVQLSPCWEMGRVDNDAVGFSFLSVMVASEFISETFSCPILPSPSSYPSWRDISHGVKPREVSILLWKDVSATTLCSCPEKLRCCERRQKIVIHSVIHFRDWTNEAEAKEGKGWCWRWWSENVSSTSHSKQEEDKHGGKRVTFFSPLSFFNMS